MILQATAVELGSKAKRWSTDVQNNVAMPRMNNKPLPLSGDVRNLMCYRYDTCREYETISSIYQSPNNLS